MSIAAIASQSGMGSQAGAMMERAAQMSDAANTGASSATKQVHISFEPSSTGAGSSPMDRIGSGLMDTLRDFEKTRASNREAMSIAQGGPASPVSTAKEELLAGPANVRPAAGGEVASASSSQPVGSDDAIKAMVRSFDYAIETQLIVKTGSQFSSSASSLMRGQ